MIRFVLLFGLTLNSACVLDSATVGEHETDGEAGSGSGGGATGNAADPSASQSSDASATTTPDTQGSDCPPIVLNSCEATRRDLTVDFLAAVDGLRDEFEDRRATLASALGAAGAVDPEALAIALEVTVGTTFMPNRASCPGTLEGARAMLQTCEPGSGYDGFGCDGECAIDATQEAACAEHGRVKCFLGFGGQCPGLCEGLCDYGVPTECDGICVGTCDGVCSCEQELGLCTATCDGSCSSMCIRPEPTMCKGGCAGLCEFAEPPGPEDCTHEGVLCVDAGPGVCVVDCKGIPSAPPGVDACCGDLVGIAGILGVECSPPELSWNSGPACPEGPAATEPVKVAIADVLVVQRRAELLGEIAADVQASIAALPAAAEGDACWQQAWGELQTAVEDATDDLADVHAEIDALVVALQ